MNDPSYREEHGIVARPHEIVKEAKTFTRADFDEMDRLRVAFYVFDNFGVLRHVARFVRSEVGVKEVDFYDRISRDAVDEPLRLADHRVRRPDDEHQPRAAVELGPVRSKRSVVTACTELGVDAGTALDTALEVQLAHLPEPSRTMPQTLSSRPRLRRVARDGARDPSRRSPRRLGAVRAAAAHVPARRDQGQRPERHLSARWSASR